MGIYETTYILHPALQEGRLNDIVNTIEKSSISWSLKYYIQIIGEEKLAYYIDKEKYGIYIFFQYKLSDLLNNLKELSGEFRT